MYRRIAPRRVTLGLIFLVVALTLAGCGTSTSKTPQGANNSQQSTGNSSEAKSEYLKPVPQGTALVTANNNVTKQLMAQKDVLGTQISEEKGIVYGKITFKTGVDKTYAHELANELLTQLKVNYPKRLITTQVIVDGKVTDSIPFKP
ncbi:hypothetical protein REC12_10015 [Desulfosporosinus sp. PR]|uniref:hypothetical protein n=1 Tax=Candidatus Desulfosporosinus nitrosoreducens TaxID=3401928 RepID=UPI0027E96981|nr:hypothetical protein [Desulfosporosinus sp. PR]MDQ7093924.1 hypothetical protein [Desulfosporosinus sp. PR]